MQDPEHAWRYQAKCMDVDTNIFYPPRDRRQYKGIADRAKAVCWGTGEGDPKCPVRSQCLWYAVSTQDTHGIWGGMSHRERSHLVRKFETLQTGMSLKAWILQHDGAGKAKRHAKAIP